MRKNKTIESLVIVILGLSIIPIAIHPGRAQVAVPGFAVSSFASGFPSGTIAAGTPFAAIAGPIGLATDSSGNLYVGDVVNGFIYKFGPAGGIASAATQLATPSSLGGYEPTGMAFGKDGNLYLGLCNPGPCNSFGEIVQLDTSTGAIIRTVAFNVPGATGLATDPLSGDLFVSQPATGTTIFRVSNFASGPGTVTAYATTQGGVDGIAFGPDGTLYASARGLGGVVKIAGTNSATPGAVTFIASIPPSKACCGGVVVDGLAISADLSMPFLYSNNNDGTIVKIDLSTSPPTLTNIVSGGSRGDFATVGSDHCLYATQSDSIIKVTNADGSCLPPPLGPLFPTNPSPSPFNSEWNAGTGLFPDQVCPAWRLFNTATPNVPLLSGGILTFTTSAVGELMFYQQSGPDISFPSNAIIEAKMKFDSGTSTDPARASANVFFNTGPNVGNRLFIGQDKVFLLSGDLTVGQTAAVDTHLTFHTYRISVDNNGGIQVSQDGIQILTGSTFNSPNIGNVPKVGFGQASTAAFGVSEWQFFRHNAHATGCQARINVSEFFTDSSLNLLPLDSKGNPEVNVTLAGGTVRSTNPGQVLAWVNVTNTSGSSVQSLKLNETLPVDWAIDPPWIPALGAIHVFFANTTSLATNPEITQPSTISVSTGNPEVVHLAISNLTATAIGHPLLKGQSILLEVKLSYTLKSTSQSATSYPIDYRDTAIAAAWTQTSFTGNQFTRNASGFFTANAKVVS